MAVVEQNISGVKLEKIRQKANNKTKFMFKMPKVVFVVCILLTLLKNTDFYAFFSGYEMNGGVIAEGVFMIIGGIILSFCIAAAVAFYMLVFGKSYMKILMIIIKINMLC